MASKPLFELTSAGQSDFFVVAPNGVHLGMMYREVDGYFVYLPAPASSGYFSQAVLLALSTKLEELNHEWDRELAMELKASDPKNETPN